MTKNKFTKLALTLGTVATIVAPIATVVSCGSDEGVKDSVLTIVAEKSWKPEMQKQIDAFAASDAGKTIMAAQGVDKIQIKEAGAFEMADRLSTKGFNDSGVSDIVLLPGDRLKGMIEQDYIKPFNEHSLDGFATSEIGSGEAFLTGAKNAAAPGLEAGADGNLGTADDIVYAIPQNVEAMVGWKDAKLSTAPTKQLTVISDLWKANGFFNTASINLKDIVKVTTTDTSSTAAYNPDLGTDGGTKAFLEAGFKNMVEGNGYQAKMILSKADDAAPEIQKHFVANKADSSIIAGPWEKSAIGEALGEDESVVATDTTDYNQWAGGWNFTINARVKTEKQLVAESFIGFLLKEDNAKGIYQGLDKMSPTVKGAEALKDTGTDALTDVADVTKMYDAVSGLQERPTAAEFGVVWGAYADTMQAMGSNIEGATDDVKLAAAATKFADDFKTAIETALKKA